MSDLAKSRSDYLDRVNRVVDHIHANLDKPLRLEELAAIAHFSAYHFHRVFKAVTGETLNAFVTRVRIDRALYLMHHGTHNLTRIALQVGFSSSSDFTRSFRKRFGVPPSVFDLQRYRDANRDHMLDQHGHVMGVDVRGNADGFVVKLIPQAARTVAYMRVWQPFEPGRVEAAVTRFLQIARAHDFANGKWLGYMWEDPEITPTKDCRYDVAVEVPAGFSPPDEDVGVLRFDQTILASIDIRGGLDVEQRALDWLFEGWLPSSGYMPDHQPTFEAWAGVPFEHGTDHFELAVQLPVTRAP